MRKCTYGHVCTPQSRGNLVSSCKVSKAWALASRKVYEGSMWVSGGPYTIKGCNILLVFQKITYCSKNMKNLEIWKNVNFINLNNYNFLFEICADIMPLLILGGKFPALWKCHWMAFWGEKWNNNPKWIQQWIILSFENRFSDRVTENQN